MAAVLLLLAVVALLVVGAIRQSQLQADLTEARAALAEGTLASWARFDALLAEHGGLDSSEPRVVALAAQGAAERAVLLGTPTAEVARAAGARVGAATDEPSVAARAWVELLADSPQIATLTQAAHAFPASGSIRHAHALGLWSSGLVDEAIAEIGAARQAEAAYLPAALTQADLLRRAGRAAPARQALAQVLPSSPGRGTVEAACLLDEAEAAATAPADVGALVAPAEATSAPRLVARAKLARGRQKLLGGDPRGAVALLREASRLDPREAEVSTQLARALWQAGDAKGAVDAADALGTRAPPAALVERALAAALLHRTRDAEATLGRIPEGATSAERLATIRALIAWQKLDLPAADHEAAAAARTAEGGALVRRAEVQLALVKRPAAVKMLRASRSACALAFARWIEGDWPAGLEAIDAARATEPACASRLAGRTGLGVRPPAEVVEALEASLGHWPDAEDRILLGRARWRAGGDGAADLAAAMEGGAESLLALSRAAEAYAEMGKSAEATALIARAKQVHGADPRVLATEIRVVRMGGNLEVAMRLSSDALQANPDQPDIARERSITLVAAERIAESERVSDIPFAAGPHFVEFARARIRAVEAAKGFPPADQQMVRALQFSQRLPFVEEVRIRSLIAMLHSRRGGRRELDAAEAFLRPLVRLDVRSADFNLAMAAVDRGFARIVQLGAHLRRSLALDPIQPEAYRWLADKELLDDPQRQAFARFFPGQRL
jgi:tetratricopeptide (TPR) repeat protein